MNKEKFLSELREKLTILSSEERESAIKYYEEYFDDAGVENEQSVIKELGNLDSVVEIILKENNYHVNDNKPKFENEFQDNSINYVNLTIFILLIIFVFPVIFPIFLTVIITLLGFIMCGFGIFVCGIVIIGFGIGALLSSAFTGILMLGIGLVTLSFGILLSYAAIWVFKTIVPVCFRSFVSICKSLLKKGGVSL